MYQSVAGSEFMQVPAHQGGLSPNFGLLERILTQEIDRLSLSRDLNMLNMFLYGYTKSRVYHNSNRETVQQLAAYKIKATAL
jgi:hypothetical protein